MGHGCCGNCEGEDQGHSKDQDCCSHDHSHDHDGHSEHSLEDVAYSAHYKIDALITLLMKKNVFTEDELNNVLDELYSSGSSESGAESSSEEEPLDKEE